LKFRHTLWTIFTRFRPSDKRFRSSECIFAQAKITLELECSFDHFCSTDKLFTQVIKDFRPSKGILVQAEIALEPECFLDHFRSSEIIFAQAR